MWLFLVLVGVCSVSGGDPFLVDSWHLKETEKVHTGMRVLVVIFMFFFFKDSFVIQFLRGEFICSLSSSNHQVILMLKQLMPIVLQEKVTFFYFHFSLFISHLFLSILKAFSLHTLLVHPTTHIRN
jgi:hypothetical protein